MSGSRAFIPEVRAKYDGAEQVNPYISERQAAFVHPAAGLNTLGDTARPDLVVVHDLLCDLVKRISGTADALNDTADRIVGTARPLKAGASDRDMIAKDKPSHLLGLINDIIGDLDIAAGEVADASRRFERLA